MHKIAVICQHISPYQGSEAAVAWNYVTMMQTNFKLIVYYAMGDEDLKKYFSLNPAMENVEFVFIPMGDYVNRRQGLVQDYYNFIFVRQWHKDVYKHISQRVADKEIELIHNLSPIGFKEPGYSWKIKDVPYVWGPIIAVENRPISLFRAYTPKTKIKVLIRRVVHNAVFRILPRVRKAMRRSDLIFAATPNSKRLIGKVYGREAEYMPENCINQMQVSAPKTLLPDEDLQIIWAGRVNDENKAIVILLDALLKVKSNRWHLHAIGKGEVSPQIAKRIESLQQNITWHGQIPRSQVLDVFSNSHLHVISSMGEATTTVLWEAMSNAVPTLTLDHCGMAGVVCPKCGIKIPIESYEKTTDRIAAEIQSLIDHPQRLNDLSNGVLECSKNFMWDARVKTFTQEFERLLS